MEQPTFMTERRKYIAASCYITYGELTVGMTQFVVLKFRPRNFK